jgi:hypothetical protein
LDSLDVLEKLDKMDDSGDLDVLDKLDVLDVLYETEPGLGLVMDENEPGLVAGPDWVWGSGSDWENV